MSSGSTAQGAVAADEKALLGSDSSGTTTTATATMPGPATSAEKRSKGKQADKKGQVVTAAGVALTVLVLAFALVRFILLDRDDPHKCRALMSRGRWLEGHSQWQPDGCMLSPYKPSAMRACLGEQHAVFIGDSSTREIFYAAARLADPKVDTSAEKHSDRDVMAAGIRFSFHWDPFLNDTAAARLLSGNYVDDDGQAPALAVIGSGLWYLRHPSSGGLPAWHSTVDHIFDSVKPGSRQVADELVLLPVTRPVESKLNAARAATMHADDTDAMNEYLSRKLHDTRAANRERLAVPRVFNAIHDGAQDETDDGLHYSDTITRTLANVVLNLRCNDALERRFPFDKTCCSRYPTPNWVQVLMLAFLLAYAPAATLLRDSPHARWFPEPKHSHALTVFGLSSALLFVADRTSLFLKENKQYDALGFGVLCALTFVAGVMTMTPADKDLGFLNREQTDEWKGWMQVAILIYHYLGASKISGIYNPIRVCVAAYLFMTGYGHLSFFLKKRDFGFARVAAILIRINLLTVVLAYLMDTDYISYYFSPLVTMWFLIIWTTLYVGNQYNTNTTFLVAKIVVAAALVGAFFELEGPLETVFGVVNGVFGTGWSAREWRFRVTLDMWIVWVGVLTALAYIKYTELKPSLWLGWQRHATIVSGVTLAGFMLFELTRESKFVYNAYHPYVSALPVLAFVGLRNATPYLRSTSSRFFIFFGQCSLETFIIQFHFFIAGDTKGIIMMIPGGAWMRPLNFVVTSLVFVFVSDQVAKATGTLTAWVCRMPKRAELDVGPTASWLLSDLRVRCFGMLAVLWLLNLVYPSDPTYEHLLPTH